MLDMNVVVVQDSKTGRPVGYALAFKNADTTRIWWPYSIMDARSFNAEGHCTTDNFVLVENTPEIQEFLVSVKSAVDSYKELAKHMGMTVTEANMKAFIERFWKEPNFRKEHAARVQVIMPAYKSTPVDPFAEAEAFLRDFTATRKRNLRRRKANG